MHDDRRPQGDPDEQDHRPVTAGEAPAPSPARTEEAAAARHAAWWAERRRRADALVGDSRRSWAAMRGWDAVTSQEEWDRITDEAAEDWASGAMLITLLGGERYLDPPRTALLQHLWQHFVGTYRPEGPAEYLCIAMALVGFHHLIRVNEFAGNLATRTEHAFFDTAPPQVQIVDRDGTTKRAGQQAQVAGREALEQLGREALPLLDRLNRMVIRNLKALRDLKAAPLALSVQNYGQLNVGQTQTNLAKSPDAPPDRPAKSKARAGGR